LKSWSQS